MTSGQGPNQSDQRTIACPRCETTFTCSLSGECWCDLEIARLPMSTDGEDCLCRECLRAEAERQSLGSSKRE